MYDDEFPWHDPKDGGRGAVWIAAFVALLIVLGFGLSFCSTAKAQMSSPERLVDPRPQGHFGVGHEPHHQRYLKLPRNKQGGSCCNGFDCRPTSARWVSGPWTGSGTVQGPNLGYWEALVNGVWTPIHPNLVLDQAYMQSKGTDRWDEQAHICTSSSKLSPTIYCLIPPDGGN